MTDFDLDRLGDVWRQRPTPAEMEELKKTADTVARRALWGQRLDLISAVAVTGVVLFLILVSTKPDTLVVGALVILILLFSQIRSRRLRLAELKEMTGTTEEMLDQSISRVQATAKRARSQLLLLLPGLGLGLLVASRVGHGGGGMNNLLPAGRAFVIAFAIAMVAATGWTMFRSLKQARQEEARLTALRQDYRREMEQSRSNVAP